jgi:hypothetical protein
MEGPTVAGIHPDGEALRRAIRFVSAALQDDAADPIGPLVERATLRFDLNPNEAEYLLRFYRKAAKQQS